MAIIATTAMASAIKAKTASIFALILMLFINELQETA